MKKKLLILIVMLVAAAILVSGCSTDQLKERIPGVKANVNTLLADNEEGDLEYQVGEVKTEEDFESSSSTFGSFGSDLINDVETEISDLNVIKGFDLPDDISGKTVTKNIDRQIETDIVNVNLSDELTSGSDVSSLLEKINFEDAQLEVIIKDSTDDINESTKILLDSFTITKNDGEAFGSPVENENIIDLSGKELNLTDTLNIDFNSRVKVSDGETIPTDPVLVVSFKSLDGSKVIIRSINVDLDEEVLDTVEGYNPKIDEVLIENYEKDEFIEYLEVIDSKMYINFDIAEGINLDLSGVVVKSDPEITEHTYPLANEDLTSDSSRAYLDLNKIVSMLQDDNTNDVKIAGDIALSSDGIITITKESELGVKNAVLESAELKIDNYQIEPEAAEEGLTSEEVNDIKKGLEEVEVIVEGINNPLPASVDLKLYVKDGASTKAELFQPENKVTTFNLKANTVNGEEVIVINEEQFDKFIGNNLYIGLELYSDFTFTKEEYNNKIVSVEKVKTKFNINLDTDDFE